MRIFEIATRVIPKNPYLDALKRQKNNLNKTIKATKAREKIAQGQRQLSAALQTPPKPI